MSIVADYDLILHNIAEVEKEKRRNESDLGAVGSCSVSEGVEGFGVLCDKFRMKHLWGS